MVAPAYDLKSQPRADHAPGELNVLYVDDELHVRNAFRRTLSRARIPVTVMESPEEALVHLESAPATYSVVAADYQMGPGLDGASFLKRVSQIAPRATRILISGQFDVPRLFEAVNNGGIYQVVSKPWDTNQLIPLIRRAGERCNLERANRTLMEKLERQNSQLHRINRELDALVMKRTHFLLDGLVSALDLRDTETQWHSRRVSEYSVRLARQMGIEGSDLIDVEYGALLHDIGKIGITDGILLKAGKLTDDEWHVMRTHPRLGYDLLQSIDFLHGAAQIVHQHHEKFDGSGYPNKYQGEGIVIGARIFSVVDALDVITTHRPYKRAKTFEWAREEIQRCVGHHFDPRVVEAYVSISDDEWREISDKHRSDEEVCHLD